jgi:hypothetical protein
MWMSEVDRLTVDEFADGLLVGVTISNEWLDDLQHLQSSLGELDEDAVVDLQQTEELQSLALLGINLVDTLDANDKSQLVLLGHVKLVLLLGLTLHADLLAVGIAVLLDVLLSTLEDDFALLLALVCAWSAFARVTSCAMNSTRGDRIIPERWLTTATLPVG